MSVVVEMGDNMSFTVFCVGIAWAIAWVRTHRK